MTAEPVAAEERLALLRAVGTRAKASTEPEIAGDNFSFADSIY